MIPPSFEFVLGNSSEVLQFINRCVNDISQ